MQISLPPELEAKIQAKVDSGMYDNVGEVIREALRFMDSHEKWLGDLKLSRLREQLLPAFNQLNGGEGIALLDDEAITAFFLALENTALDNHG